MTVCTVCHFNQRTLRKKKKSQAAVGLKQLLKLYKQKGFLLLYNSFPWHSYCISALSSSESHTHTRTHATIVLTRQHPIKAFTSSWISTPGAAAAAAAEVEVHMESRRTAVARPVSMVMQTQPAGSNIRLFHMNWSLSLRPAAGIWDTSFFIFSIHYRYSYVHHANTPGTGCLCVKYVTEIQTNTTIVTS